MFYICADLGPGTPLGGLGYGIGVILSPVNFFWILPAICGFLLFVGLSWLAVTARSRGRHMKKFLADPVTSPVEIPLWGALCEEPGKVVIEYRPTGVFMWRSILCLCTWVSPIIIGVTMDLTTITADYASIAALVISLVLARFARVSWVRSKRVRLDVLVGEKVVTRERASGMMEFAFDDISSWHIRRTRVEDQHEREREDSTSLMLKLKNGKFELLHKFDFEKEDGNKVAMKVAEYLARETNLPVTEETEHRVKHVSPSMTRH